jgi:predicted secreted protein
MTKKLFSNKEMKKIIEEFVNSIGLTIWPYNYNKIIYVQDKKEGVCVIYKRNKEKDWVIRKMGYLNYMYGFEFELILNKVKEYNVKRVY